MCSHFRHFCIYMQLCSHQISQSNVRFWIYYFYWLQNSKLFCVCRSVSEPCRFDNVNVVTSKYSEQLTMLVSMPLNRKYLLVQISATFTKILFLLLNFRELDILGENLPKKTRRYIFCIKIFFVTLKSKQQKLDAVKVYCCRVIDPVYFIFCQKYQATVVYICFIVKCVGSHIKQQWDMLNFSFYFIYFFRFQLDNYFWEQIVEMSVTSDFLLQQLTCRIQYIVNFNNIF
eukprot:TRINITY_DN29519_c0_g1_i2.p1 TRINITY_DN29519_c0_g1~~TRINITY_DN29519_c0_g1_i2.p1  ORF type:complete len:230 (+),score=-8.88 TRINITY_DN29519_c0_g1_i2:675-1364(+)